MTSSDNVENTQKGFFKPFLVESCNFLSDDHFLKTAFENQPEGQSFYSLSGN